MIRSLTFDFLEFTLLKAVLLTLFFRGYSAAGGEEVV